MQTMTILYLVSLAVLFLSFLLLKKSKNKINLLPFLCISIIALLIHNTLSCYILTFFAIRSSFFNLSIINIILSIFMIYKIISSKEVQKYKIYFQDTLHVILISAVIIGISYLNFGYPFNVNYETGDPSVHYLIAVRSAENETLLPGIPEPDEVYGSLPNKRPVSYCNSALVMRCVSENLDFIECYNVFVYFGIAVLLVTSISIYALFSELAKTKLHRFFGFLIATICAIGYPLNSLLFGFEYLSMGILIIVGIMIMVQYYKNQVLGFKHSLFFFGMLNFGLFMSYYLFVPFVYPTLWIYFCIQNYFFTNKFVTKKLLLMLLVTLLIPFALGFIYCLEPNIYIVFLNTVWDNNNFEYAKDLVSNGFKQDGYSYMNFYSNILLLIPLLLYYLHRLFKIDLDAKEDDVKDDDTFYVLFLFLTVLFIGLLIVGYALEKVSLYYISKNYYVLWLILFYFYYRAIQMLTTQKNGKLMSIILTFGYIGLIALSLVYIHVPVVYLVDRTTENVSAITEIFGANKTIITEKPVEYNQDEIEILRWVRENLDYNTEIEVVTDENAYYWAYTLLRYVNLDEEFEGLYVGQPELSAKLFYLLEYNIKKADYVVYFNKSDRYKELSDEIFDKAEVVFENSAGGVVKKTEKIEKLVSGKEIGE